MERKQFFILEKDFLNTREVGDLIEALGPGGVGAYMAILIYLRHQPAYTTCYRPSLLSQLARCNNGTVELFRDVLLNFGLFDFGEGEEPEFHSFYLDRVMEPMDRRCANSRRNGAKGGRPPKVARTVHNVIPEVMEEVTEPVAEEPLQLAVAEEEKPRKTYNTIQNNTEQYNTTTETTEKSKSETSVLVPVAAAIAATTAVVGENIQSLFGFRTDRRIRMDETRIDRQCCIGHIPIGTRHWREDCRSIPCLPHLLGVSGRSGDRKIRASGCQRSGP